VAVAERVMDDQTASVEEPIVDDSSTSPINPEEGNSSEENPGVEDSSSVEDSSGTGDSSGVEVSPQEGSASDDEFQWYVLKVQSNREKSIRQSLLRRIKRENLGQYFGDIIIPTEKVAETKSGKKRITEVKLYPGYIMVHMILNDESWYLVRDTSGVGDFTGTAGKPIPMQDDEVKRMLGDKEAVDVEPKKVKIDLEIGETIKIKEGGFESFEGTIDAIDQTSGKITVLVEIFGRSTPVELEYWQVEKV
jgi:transcriptional antiterminator NusG